MDWTPGGMSDDIEDRRGDSGGGGGFNFGGGGGLGIGGLVVLLIVSLITGRNFIGSYLTGGSSAQQSQGGIGHSNPPESADEKRSAQLVSFVLDDVQRTWPAILAQQGVNYRRAKLVLFRDSTYSGCGTAEATTGPLRCPADEKVYIDLGFWDELSQLGGGKADFAQAYVLAHEQHCVQDILGTEAAVRRLQGQNPSLRNKYSVAMELQGGLLRRVWAQHRATKTSSTRKISTQA